MVTAVREQNQRKLRTGRRRLVEYLRPQSRPYGFQPLPNGWRILAQTAKTLWANKKLLVLITLVYAGLNLILVHGLSSSGEVTSLKGTLNDLSSGKAPIFASTAAILAYLTTASTNARASGASGAYGVLLLLIVSLAVIWALRQVAAGHPASFKQAYYKGMQPLVPFILVVGLMAVQLLPFVVGAVLYVTVVANGIAVYWYEHLISIISLVLLGAWSGWMIMSSVIGLYIVTLPNMTPLKAVRSARKLIKFRRWSIIRKLILLSLVSTFITALIMVPIIIFATAVAPWMFYALTIFVVTIVHTYMYTLYRELINHAV